MQQTTASRNKQKFPALVSVSEYGTKDHLMVLTCTKTGVMLPLDETGMISASHPFLSEEIGTINVLDGDTYLEIQRKRSRTHAREILKRSTLQEVHLPRWDQVTSAAIPTVLKEHDQNMIIYQVMFLRAEEENAPHYVHVPYAELTKDVRLCPVMRDVIVQLVYLDGFEDFVSKLTDEED